MRISTSMKRATISFTIPGKGRTTVQENEGVESKELRAAIQAAHDTFWPLYLKWSNRVQKAARTNSGDVKEPE